MYLVYFFALIGFITCAIFARAIIQEIHRALLQSHRVATAGARQYRGHRHPTRREWFYHFRQDFFSTYSAKQVGHFELDHDPSVPAYSMWKPR